MVSFSFFFLFVEKLKLTDLSKMGSELCVFLLQPEGAEQDGEGGVTFCGWGAFESTLCGSDLLIPECALIIRLNKQANCDMEKSIMR